MKNPKTKMGRPRLPKNAAASAQIQIRVTPARKRAYTHAAGSAGLSAWLISLADRAVAESTG